MKRLLAIFGLLLLLLLAVPRRASAYVDPGSGAMIWQVLAAAAIGSLFYVRKVVTWMRRNLVARSPRMNGYLFAACYAAVASPVICSIFRSHPVPRFSDVFLVGVALTAYLFTWDAAVALLSAGLLVSAYVLPPDYSLYVARPEDWYRLASFGIVSALLILLITQLKGRPVEARPLSRAAAAAGRLTAPYSG